jgi:hypothetical protein
LKELPLITINIAQGLLQYESWADIEATPGFQRDIDPKVSKLDSILGRYVFLDRVVCGLSNCHTLHGKGYIVKTKDGTITNIGKDCGSSYFGVDFDRLSATFERDLKQKEQRERLHSFSLQTEDIQARVSELRKADKGATWIHMLIERLKSPRDIPEPIVRQLSAMVKGRTNRLTKTRKADKTEAEALEAAGQNGPHFVEDVVAELEGFSALYPENDLRQLLVFGVDEAIREFDKLDIGSMSPGELSKWVKRVGTVESSLEQAEQAIGEGRKFLTATNLEPLMQVDGIWRDGMPDFKNYLKLLKKA